MLTAVHYKLIAQIRAEVQRRGCDRLWVAEVPGADLALLRDLQRAGWLLLYDGGRALQFHDRRHAPIGTGGWVVYSYRDRAGLPVYVGKSSAARLAERHNEHIASAQGKRPGQHEPFHKLLKGWLAQGYEPQPVVEERCATEEDALERESAWIAWLREQGWNLQNVLS
jgi:hypothetical protein